MGENVEVLNVTVHGVNVCSIVILYGGWAVNFLCTVLVYAAIFMD